MKTFAVVATFFLLSACAEQRTLITVKDERDMRSVLFCLAKQDIDVQETKVEEGIELSVKESDFIKALEVLETSGLPRHDYDSVLEIFSSDGMFSSPGSERVRMRYALEQQIAESLAEIRGVHSVRVHIVMPELDRRQREVHPPSAAVIVVHNDELDIFSARANIQRFVASASANIPSENVSISFFEGGGTGDSPC